MSLPLARCVALSLSLVVSLGCDAGPMSRDAGRDAAAPRDAGGSGMDARVLLPDGGGAASLCLALEGFVARCGASASPCATQLIAGCDELVAALGSGFVAAVEACLPTSNPTNCFFDAVAAVSPSAAQTGFRDAFCDGCLADEPTCDADFFTSTESARAVVLAVSDATATELTTRCAAGVLCSDRVDMCAAETLGLLGVPAATAQCFVDTLLAARPLPVGCGVAVPDAGLDGGGVASDGGSDAGGGPADGGTPVEPAACMAREPNENRAGARLLGDIDDASSFPAGNLSAGIASGGDEDWFSFPDADTAGGFLYPRVDLVISGSGDLDLCVYFACDSAGSATISCATGTTSSLGGLDGCCSTGLTTMESVRLDPNCPGLSDSGTAYVRVYAGGTIPACQSYFLAWGDD